MLAPLSLTSNKCYELLARFTNHRQELSESSPLALREGIVRKLLTEPEKYIEALLHNDQMRRQEEEIRRLLTERDGSLRNKSKLPRR